MIARHDGAMVLVSAAIPGETVDAVVEKVQRGTVWARTTRVLEPSPDRIDAEGDWACGGNVFAHVRYERQLALKRDIIRDAFMRIGRMPPPRRFPVAASPIDGYRMRARLHVADGRIGFFHEGRTSSAIRADAPAPAVDPEVLEMLRGIAGSQSARSDVGESSLGELPGRPARASISICSTDADPSRLGSLPPMPGSSGMSCGHRGGRRALVLSGSPR